MKNKRLIQGLAGVLLLSIAVFSFSEPTKAQKPDPFDVGANPATIIEGSGIKFVQEMDNFGVNHITISTKTTTMVFPNATVSGNTTALASGVKKVTVTGITGLLVGDRIMLTPAGTTPTGFGVMDAVCATAGQMEVNVFTPALSVLTAFSIPVKITVFR